MNPLFLQTFGVPALLRVENDGETRALALRRKDLALLVFLCVEGKRTYSRSLLGSMLWGDASEERARHSLTQTLGRLRPVVGPDSFELTTDRVIWKDRLGCDAAELAEGRNGAWPKSAFLSDFNVGHGAAEFEIWAEEKRTYFRRQVLQQLDERGRRAEEAGAWDEALALGHRAIDVEPIHEEGHRRVMRAWAAMGERGLALQHFRSMKRWLRSEFEEEPEALTGSLAEEIAAASEPAERSASTRTWPPLPLSRTSPPAWPTAGRDASDASHAVRERPWHVLTPARTLRLAVAVIVAALLLVSPAPLPWHWLDADEFVKVPGDGQAALVDGEVYPRLLYGRESFHFPDWETYMACSGWQPGIIALLPRPPGGPPARTLPSVLEHFSLAGHDLVRGESEGSPLFAVVGCVKSLVPDPVRAGFAEGRPIHVVADTVLSRLPTGPALETPLRRAGTILIERGGRRMRWVLFAGGALQVPSLRVLASYCRTSVVEVDSAELEKYRVVGSLKHADFQCGYVPFHSVRSEDAARAAGMHEADEDDEDG